jgi:pyruvate/2-oxoglutarate/acetoin dehydrogenase E1 component
LDKFLVGIDNVTTIALNTFVDPAIVYRAVLAQEHPVIVLENKTDYGKKIAQHIPANFIAEYNAETFPVVRIRPAVSVPTLTIAAYGGMADLVAGMLGDIFPETELLPELIVPTCISRLPLDLVAASVSRSGRLVVIEEGSAFAGVGGELIAAVVERTGQKIRAKRIAAYPVPIPSVKTLENIVLPDRVRILQEIKISFA